MERLPVDILTSTLRFLEVKDLIRCRRVGRHLNRVIRVNAASLRRIDNVRVNVAFPESEITKQSDYLEFNSTRRKKKFTHCFIVYYHDSPPRLATRLSNGVSVLCISEPAKERRRFEWNLWLENGRSSIFGFLENCFLLHCEFKNFVIGGGFRLDEISFLSTYCCRMQLNSQRQDAADYDLLEVMRATNGNVKNLALYSGSITKEELLHPVVQSLDSLKVQRWGPLPIGNDTWIQNRIKTCCLTFDAGCTLEGVQTTIEEWKRGERIIKELSMEIRHKGRTIEKVERMLHECVEDCQMRNHYIDGLNGLKLHLNLHDYHISGMNTFEVKLMLVEPNPEGEEESFYDERCYSDYSYESPWDDCEVQIGDTSNDHLGEELHDQAKCPRGEARQKEALVKKKKANRKPQRNGSEAASSSHQKSPQRHRRRVVKK